MNNHEKYFEKRTPPKDALKTIKGGRLQGMTDINPQWRIEALTEMYGLCGFGWWYEVVSIREIDCPDGSRLLSVSINLYLKVGEETSQPIPGTGGSTLISKEKDKYGEEGAFKWHNNDEAHKMAITDALSVACKQIGIASDIYRGYSDSKYVGSSKDDKDEKSTFYRKSRIEQAKEDLAGIDYAVIKKQLDNYEVKRASDLKGDIYKQFVEECKEAAKEESEGE